MMDVYSWWAQAHFEPDQWEVAEAARQAATLAERERLKKAISSDYKFIEENYISLPGETGQYYGGRLDSYDEVLHVINNP